MWAFFTCILVIQFSVMPRSLECELIHLMAQNLLGTTSVSGSVPCRPAKLSLHVHKCPCTPGGRSGSNCRVAASYSHPIPFPPCVEEVLMGAQPLLSICLVWWHHRQERVGTWPPQGQLPSRGLVLLSPALTHCCPSRRKLPHPAEWIPSSMGRLRKEVSKKE